MTKVDNKSDASTALLPHTQSDSQGSGEDGLVVKVLIVQT